MDNNGRYSYDINIRKLLKQGTRFLLRKRNLKFIVNFAFPPCISVKTVLRQSNLKFRPEKPGMTPISLTLAWPILKCLFRLMRLPVLHIVVYQGCAIFITEGPNALL